MENETIIVFHLLIDYNNFFMILFLIMEVKHEDWEIFENNTP